MSTTLPRASRFPALATLRGWRPQCTTETLILLTSVFFAVACNGLFWHSAMATHPGSVGFALSLFLFLGGAHCLLMGLLVWRWNAKVVLSVLLIGTALAAHYMSSYHIYLDADMLRNVLATDHKESRELITPTLIAPLLLLALAPMLLLWRVQLRRRTLGRALLWRMGFLLLSALIAFGGAMLSFQEMSSLMRNQREVRYLATPGNVLLGLPKALRGDNPIQRAPKLPIGTDAKATPRAVGSRPRLLVIVMGETARAQNWGLNGYAKQTTPELAQAGVINFPDMHSCGTSTEVSLPCLFSPYGRHDYDEKKIRAHQSLLHVLDHAGIATLWRDNQSGCKGVCEGLEMQPLDDAKHPTLCANGRCMDEILIGPGQVQPRADHQQLRQCAAVHRSPALAHDRHTQGHGRLRHGDDLSLRSRRVAWRERPLPAWRALRDRPAGTDPGTDDDVVLALVRGQPRAQPGLRAGARGQVHRPRQSVPVGAGADAGQDIGV